MSIFIADFLGKNFRSSASFFAAFPLVILITRVRHPIASSPYPALHPRMSHSLWSEVGLPSPWAFWYQPYLCRGVELFTSGCDTAALLFVRDAANAATLPASVLLFLLLWFFLGMFSRLSLTGESLSCDLWIPLGWRQPSRPQGLCPNGCPLSPSMGPFWCSVKAFCSAGFYNNDSLDGFFLTFLFPFDSAALLQCSQSSELKFVT